MTASDAPLPSAPSPGDAPVVDALAAADLPPAGDAAAALQEEIERQLVDLRRELKAAQDRELRTLAELENFRKRMRRELEEERRFAATPLLVDTLAVLDNLRLAVDAGAKDAAAANSSAVPNSAGDKAAGELLRGVKMVVAQFEELLSKHGCRRIETVGAAFDPHRHEALFQEPHPEHASGQVSRELRAGYTLHDRVLRPAQVAVSSGPA